MLFFRCDLPGLMPTALPPGMAMRIWAPARDGFPPPPLRRSNIAWWMMDRMGLFARRDFAEITLWQGRHLVHRLILTPRWYRFPFMGAQDLQIGDVWTHPALRGLGLALLGVQQGLALAAPLQARVWYVAEASHSASIALAGRAGFALAGQGWRSCPFSLRALGRYRLAPPPPR